VQSSRATLKSNVRPCGWCVLHALQGLFVGYRWHDAHNSPPAFPFGHGLSYTTFGYSNLTATASGVSFTLTNTGSVAGAEVAQLYLGFPASAGEPPQQLKGFQKVCALCEGRGGGDVMYLSPLHVAAGAAGLVDAIVV
jgi:hypothetical protein